MSQEVPSVSVIIPTFNASKTVHVALDSVLAQRFRDLEIVIVDDKSDDYDDLLAVVNLPKYQSLSIRTFPSDKKLYASGARNRGFDVARGSYAALLDADDEWEPDKLTETIKRLKDLEERDVGRSIVYTGSRICLNGETIKHMPVEPMAQGETMAEYLFGPRGWIQTSTIVLKLDHARQIRFNPEFRRHQDYDFCIRAAAMGYSFDFIDKPLVRYHVDPKGLNAKGETTGLVRQWLKVMTPYLNHRDLFTYRAYELPRRIRADRGMLAAALVFAANYPFTSHRNRKAFAELLKTKFLERFGPRRS
jgi:amylovoran biosynthesis glycosyltransferase AmsB